MKMNLTFFGGGGGGSSGFSGTQGSSATEHGAQRLRERGFSDAERRATMRSNNVRRQADGARVHINETSPGRFNVIVTGERGVITAFRNIRQSALDRLARNYGWE